jgi:ATP-dependent Clp protease ATP-binding subunit ClpB
MRQDKLTTKFQEALSDAQSLALGRDHGYIEPLHLLAAMLHQDDGPGALLQRSGVNLAGLQTATEAAIKKLPQVQGQDQIQISTDLAKLLQATEKEALKRADQFIAGELFLLALCDSKTEAGRVAVAGLKWRRAEALPDRIRRRLPLTRSRLCLRADPRAQH